MITVVTSLEPHPLLSSYRKLSPGQEGVVDVLHGRESEVGKVVILSREIVTSFKGYEIF